MVVSGSIVALVLVVFVLSVTGTLQLAHTAAVERIGTRLGIPPGVLRAMAPIQLVAAAFLVLPQTRIWGISAAAGLLLAAIVIVVTRGRLLWSVLPIFLLAAVGMACLTIS